MFDAFILQFKFIYLVVIHLIDLIILNSHKLASIAFFARRGKAHSDSHYFLLINIFFITKLKLDSG